MNPSKPYPAPWRNFYECAVCAAHTTRMRLMTGGWQWVCCADCAKIFTTQAQLERLPDV